MKSSLYHDGTDLRWLIEYYGPTLSEGTLFEDV